MKILVKWLKRFYLLYMITFRCISRKDKRVKELAWFGAYGNTNIGDDLIFFSLKRYVPSNVKIHLSCRQHIPTTDYGVDTFYRGDRNKCKHIIRKSDAVWLGGGGLFEYYANTYPESWIVGNLLPLVYALHYGKKYAIVGMGCNEKAIPNVMLRYIFRKVCNKADYIITRDEKSKRGFENNGVNNLYLRSCLDPVLAYQDVKCSLKKEIKTVGILAWPFYMWPYFHVSSSLSEIYSQMTEEKKEKHKLFITELRKLKEQLELFGINVVFPVFHFSDTILLEEMEPINKKKYDLPNIENYISEIKKCDIVISMRYHGQITNYTQGNIVISVPVQEKMFALNERFNAKDLEVPLETFNCNTILDIIKKIQSHPDFYRERNYHILNEIQPFIQNMYVSMASKFFN